MPEIPIEIANRLNLPLCGTCGAVCVVMDPYNQPVEVEPGRPCE